MAAALVGPAKARKWTGVQPVDDGSASRYQLRLLDSFELRIEDRGVPLPLQAQRVLGYLAVVQPVQSRSVLAGCLWADVPQERAMATLRNALWRLRAADSALVRTSRETVTLSPFVRTDLWRARRSAAAITSEQSVRCGPELIGMLGADLLTTWDDDWLRIERERLRQLRIHALEFLAEQLIQRGRHAEAIQAALTAVAAEPLRESAQIALIRAFLGEGNTSEAIRQYRSFRDLLAAELGLRPSARIQTMLRDHLRPGRPDRQDPAPSLAAGTPLARS